MRLEENGIDDFRNKLHLRLFHAPRRYRGRADPYAARNVRPFCIEGDHVSVEYDPAPLQALLRFYSGDALSGEVHKEEMVVRPPDTILYPRFSKQDARCREFLMICS